MEFKVGDKVMHWKYGLGEVISMEVRDMTGERQLYYEVKIHDFSVWVPADEMLSSRLRLPATAAAFRELLIILSKPAQPLPEDRQERKSRLDKEMTAGDTASMCHVLRDLTSFAEQKQLNYEDKATLKWARSMLLGEWEYSLGVPRGQAEGELHGLLKRSVARPGG
jgi:CarD family transcriptional regulator, regulator of rRNA transcription